MSGISDSTYRLDINQIQNYLPHRAPFLLIDRILSIDVPGPKKITHPEDIVGARVTAIKNVSYNESYFQGHFPGMAILPGVLIAESMAQTASFSLYPHFSEVGIPKDLRVILVGLEGIRFRKPVYPGDSMILQSQVKKCRERLWVFEVSASVRNEADQTDKVAEGEIFANIYPNVFRSPRGEA